MLHYTCIKTAGRHRRFADEQQFDLCTRPGALTKKIDVIIYDNTGSKGRPVEGVNHSSRQSES